MNDLVRRLRKAAKFGGHYTAAADEIERLRQENDAWQNQNLLEQCNRQADKIEELRDAVDSAFKWLAISGRHSPTCSRMTNRIVPDGAHHSGLSKDYGGRYATDEELDKAPCSCGLADLHGALCQATTDPVTGAGDG